MIITTSRANPAGLHFTFMNVYGSDQTKVTCGYKFIFVTSSLEEIWHRWHRWAIMDEPIETALNNLNEYQREFLLTGRSPMAQELGE